MTQNEKDLLLKDLCARLPYGVKLHCSSNVMICIGPYTLNTIVLDRIFNNNTEYVPFDEFKPYLFPFSSITDEQKYTCPIGVGELEIFIENANWSIMQIMPDSIIPFFDWLHKNHFDYRGLIEKGLAIDATNLNIY